ncbi:MAG: hypothetical protein HY744_27795, partial [Deltaproteobacteria bacterium]|nr:hypothetical protein [Deltaproteobacteria bacterium]
MSPPRAVQIYKEPGEVERAFRCLKDVLELRPIFHQTPERVQAHVFVAALGFVLHRALEKKLKGAGIYLSATKALGVLRTVRVVDMEFADGSTERCVTRGSPRAGAILIYQVRKSSRGAKKNEPPRRQGRQDRIRFCFFLGVLGALAVHLLAWV